MAKRFASLLLLTLATVIPSRAFAYPWMIRHDYVACAQCHADPSGGGLLTQYGRAQGELLLRTHYSKKEEEDPGPGGKFAFGVPLPDPILIEVASRTGRFEQHAGGATIDRTLVMQDDIRAQVQVWKIRVNGSLAYADQGAQLAQVTSNDRKNILSREHWIGFDATDEILVRAGRMMVPFGVRDVYHEMYVRKQTRTDINQDQTHGLAVSYSGAQMRGEAMLLAGNLQLAPDDLRERGYSGYLEYAIPPGVFPRTSLGVSSMLGHSAVDLTTKKSDYNRTVNGVFVRAAPWKPIAVLAEADVLVNNAKGDKTRVGNAGYAQLDGEPLQGVHLQFTTEWFHDPTPNIGTSYAYWESINWYAYSHVDLRLDFIQNDVPAAAAGSRIWVHTTLFQVHFYL